MAIYDDFTINYAEKRITHTSGSTVYTVNAFYSWLMDDFDAQGQMDDTVPMSAQTPNAYTMINEWFIDEVSTQYLKEGAIQTSGWTGEIRCFSMESAAYTPCIASDIGKTVTGGTSGHTGTLLYYDNTKRKWWIRSVQAFQDAEVCTVTSGDGIGTTMASGRATGESIYSNIYTLGSIVSGSQIYVVQDGTKITEWWSTDHIDILVKIQEMDAVIDSGYLWIFNRDWTDLNDHYQIDVSNGGRNAVPLATADDANNATAVGTVGNYYDVLIAMVNGTLPYDTGTGSAVPVVNKVLWDEVSNAVAYVLKTGAAVAAGTLTLGDVEGTFGDGNALSTLAELKFDAQTGQFSVGLVVTGGSSSATGTIRKVVQDPEGDGTSGILYLSGVSGGPFTDGETITDTSTGSADADGVETAAPDWAADVNGSMTSAHTMVKDLQNGDGDQPYDIIINGGGRPVDEIYEWLKFRTRRTCSIQMYRVEASVVTPIDGEQYDIAYTGYSPVKASPLGTFAGGKFFGARGVWLENMDSNDAQNIQLIDSDGDTQVPPNWQDVKVDKTVSGDQVAVFLLTGAGGDIDKDMCGGVDTTSSGLTVLNTQGAIPTDLPQSGSLRVIYSGDGLEDIYTYTGYSGTQFTGLSPVTQENYTTADDVYVPFIDEAATGTDVTVSIIQSSTRNVLVRVRKKGIIPFEIESTISATGMNVAAIRTTDSIVV